MADITPEMITQAQKACEEGHLRGTGAVRRMFERQGEGALTGGIIGSVIPGVGTVSGAIAGLAAGALASVGETILEENKGQQSVDACVGEAIRNMQKTPQLSRNDQGPQR